MPAKVLHMGKIYGIVTNSIWVKYTEFKGNNTAHLVKGYLLRTIEERDD